MLGFFPVWNDTFFACMELGSSVCWTNLLRKLSETQILPYLPGMYQLSPHSMLSKQFGCLLLSIKQ